MELLKKARINIITHHPHFIKRWMARGIDLDKVEGTIRTGKAFKYSQRKKKLGLERYYGKENETYCVICIVEEDIIEVKTIWKRKGR